MHNNKKTQTTFFSDGVFIKEEEILL